MMLPMSVSDGPGRLPTWSEVRAVAHHAEAVGLDSVWVCDHLLSESPGQPVEGIAEGWTLLAALAASTARLTLGTLVTPTVFRHPALLAKMAAGVDGISGGRLVLGLGAGFAGAEYRMYGIAASHRWARFEEELQIIVGLLSGKPVTWSGRFHELHDATLQPTPARRVPVMVAGEGERTMRLAARYADAWTTAWYGWPDEQLRARLGAMACILDEHGRDPATLRRMVGVEAVDPGHEPVRPGGLTLAREDLAAGLDGYRQLGIDDLIIGLRPVTVRSIDRLVEAQALFGG
jgi:alkanesulfonate monooxygenase SsuD/methylene tetrahydromethanopterin reductase-like flavin-dependent oxidoreductase (luciferase family)